MAQLTPPPFGTNINEPSGFMSKGWIQWFQDIQEDTANGLNSVADSTIASDDTMDIVSGISSDYGHYSLVLQDILISQPSDVLNLRVSTDKGSTFESGAADYTWILETNTGTISTTTDSADNKLQLTPSSLNNASDSIINGEIEFFTPAGTSNASHFKWDIQYKNTSGVLTTVKGSGLYNIPAAFDGIRLYLNTGVLTSGSYKLYGIR
jgi:hypothetical protein